MKEDVVGYMQILHYFYMRLEHPQILLSAGVLEPISNGHQRMTVLNRLKWIVIRQLHYFFVYLFKHVLSMLVPSLPLTS